MLKIGEVSKQTDVPQDTLRYYEQQGLLIPEHRSEAGYRLYSKQDIEKLRFILSAKTVGFTLKEIQDLLELEVTRDEKSCQDVKEFVDHKIDIINQRIKEMQQMKKSLSALSEACCGGDEPATYCTILETLRDNETTHELAK